MRCVFPAVLTRLDVRAHPRLPHAHRSLRCSQAERALTAEEIWRKSESFRRQHAISSDAFIFCSFNQFYKITPELWQAWLNILQRVPGLLRPPCLNDRRLLRSHFPFVRKGKRSLL